MGPGAAFRAAEEQDLFWRLLVAGRSGRHVVAAVVDHPAWRTFRQLLSTEWAYGVGAGALVAKARRLGVDGPTLRGRAWDNGVALAARGLRRGWKRPAVRLCVRAAGVVVGAVRARRLALGPDHRFS